MGVTGVLYKDRAAAGGRLLVSNPGGGAIATCTCRAICMRDIGREYLVYIFFCSGALRVQLIQTLVNVMTSA
jgi:hypothetical protein